MNFEASSQGSFPEVPKGWDIQGDLDAAVLGMEAAPPQSQAASAVLQIFHFLWSRVTRVRVPYT